VTPRCVLPSVKLFRVMRPSSNNTLERVFPFVATAAFVLSLTGYPLLSFFLNPDYTRAITIPFRFAMVGLLALTALLAIAQGSRRLPISASLALIFCVIYTIRFAHDTIYRPIDIFNPPLHDAILIYFGICLPAFFGLLFVRDPRAVRNAGEWFYWATYAICVAGLVFQANEIVREQTRLANGNTYLIGNPSLNHVTFGHMGLLLVAMSAYKLGCRRYSNWVSLAFLIAAIPLGVGVMLLADSRSALIGSIFVVPVALFGAVRTRNLVLIAGVGGITILAATWLIGYAAYVNLDLAAVFKISQYTEGESTFNRETMAVRAIHQFEEHPLLGDMIVEDTYREYPHNILLEAFMATGFFGGVLYLLLWGRCGWIALRLAGNVQYGWLTALFLQQMIEFLSSGSIFVGGDAWAVLALFAGMDNLAIERATQGRQTDEPSVELPEPVYGLQPGPSTL
jgi:hypothetical protein